MDIKALTNKKKYTKADKEYLVAEGAKYGVEAPRNENCPDCWRDMAIRIAVAMRPKDDAPAGVRLRGRAAVHGVWFLGRLVMNPIDAETLRWMREKAFPEQLLEDAEG